VYQLTNLNEFNSVGGGDYDNGCNDVNNYYSNGNNSIKFFIIYVPSHQPQGQLQAQHSVDKNNYFMNRHNIKSKTS
jgi:hypothetical protein